MRYYLFIFIALSIPSLSSANITGPMIDSYINSYEQSSESDHQAMRMYAYGLVSGALTFSEGQVCIPKHITISEITDSGIKELKGIDAKTKAKITVAGYISKYLVDSYPCEEP